MSFIALMFLACIESGKWGASGLGTYDDSGDTGVTDDPGDCDPADDDVYAGAPELEDGKDNDCDGWTDERAPGGGDLVITEIMDDTDPTEDDFGEWFEITNDTDVPLELVGLTVSDAKDESFTLDDAVVLEPGALLVFGASDDETQNGGYTPDLLFDPALFHLGNDEDEIILTLGGALVDEVAYDADFPHEKGKSRSLDPDEVGDSKNDDPSHWCEGDGKYGTDENQGTPGEGNDDC